MASRQQLGRERDPSAELNSLWYTAPMSARIGVDIGGTFTDIVLVDESTGRMHVGKILTTPKDPAHAVEQATQTLLGDAAVPARMVHAVAHGTPVEVIESLSPLIVERKTLREDSGGPGKYRGGLGQTIAFRVRTGEPFVCSVLGDRTRTPAAGFLGGGTGARGAVLIDGAPPANPKAEQLLAPGVLVEARLPGGGGYGRPDLRDPELIARDLEEGYVSRADGGSPIAATTSDPGSSTGWIPRP